MGLLRQFAPNARAITMLMNPTYRPTAAEVRDAQGASGTLGLLINVLYPGSAVDIDAAFVTLGRERPDALFLPHFTQKSDILLIAIN